jgi:hypothetical protein
LLVEGRIFTKEILLFCSAFPEIIWVADATFTITRQISRQVNPNNVIFFIVQGYVSRNLNIGISHLPGQGPIGGFPVIMFPLHMTWVTMASPTTRHEFRLARYPCYKKGRGSLDPAFPDCLYVIVLPCGIARVVYYGMAGGGGGRIDPLASFLYR